MTALTEADGGYVGGLPDLLSRLRFVEERASRSIAFCVGSALTAPQVPGVADAITWMRASLGDSERDRADYDAAVGSDVDGAAYQRAAAFLLSRRGQDEVNQVIRSLTLNAHRPTIQGLAEGSVSESDFTDEYCREAETDPGAWYIPTQVQFLAQLILARSAYASGPVLTTNFDPLLELAVRRQGGAVAVHSLDADGRVADVEVVGGVHVVHLHGYWRTGDTLHVPAQLRQRRDQLQASLEELLRQRTLIVTAYGGWDDVFTTALTEAVRRHRFGELEVLWTLFEEDDARIGLRYSRLLRELRSVPGRVSLYKGIEIGGLLSALIDGGSDADDGEGGIAVETFMSPLEGWTSATAEGTLRQSVGLALADLALFFDGQVPTWSHATADAIPKLSTARELVHDVGSAHDATGLRLEIVLGPASEGKSTAARQVAAHFGLLGGAWRVLWREIGAAGSSFAWTSLERGEWRWLLTIDDADVDAQRAFDAIRALREAGRDDVTVLMMARDTDWNAAGAHKMPWDEHVVVRRRDLAGLTADDAVAVVESWATAGPAGLKDLVTVSGTADRARVLHRAAAEEAARPEGSFLGAMLRVRYGTGLDAHVRDLMNRLQKRPLRDADLLRAFLLIAAVHAQNVLTLRPAVVAGAMGVPKADSFRDLVWPLGQEAAVTNAGASLLVRHRAIAESALRLAGDFNEDVAEIYYDVLRATVRARLEGEYIPDMASYIYLPSRMEADARVIVRAAEGPRDEDPQRLGFRTNLCRALRGAGRVEEALEEAATAFARRQTMHDLAPDLRGFLFEWGVCFGVNRMPSCNATLACLSMVDLADVLWPYEGARLSYSLTGAGEAFDALVSRDAVVATRARDAAYALLARSEGRRIDYGITTPSIDECWAAIRNGGTLAVRTLERPLPEGLPLDSSEWSFAEASAILK